MAIFATVAEKRSFRGAAKKLSLSPSIVSLHIKKLETQIGAPLFYRSTRKVTLTDEGRLFYRSAKTMITAARDGLDQFAGHASTNLTELRVAMPDTLSTNPVLEKLVAFSKNHTGIRLNLISTDIQQNLIGEGHDVAIRMGSFKDSDLKTKRIGADERVLVGSPSYVQARSRQETKPPTHPEDLENWDFVSFSLVPDRIELQRGPETRAIWGHSAARASSAQTVGALCCAGIGLAALPYHLVKRDLEAGRLIRVLPDWVSTKPLPIFLVWAQNADLSLATREFINFMSQSARAK